MKNLRPTHGNFRRPRGQRTFSSFCLEAFEPRVLFSISYVAWGDGGGLANDGEYIVQTTNGQDFATVASNYGLSVGNMTGLGSPGLYVFSTDASISTVAGWQAAHSDDIELIEPDYVSQLASVPSPNSNQWFLNNTGQTLTGTLTGYGNATSSSGDDIKAISAWNVTTGTNLGQGVVVAVLDTGIDWNNPGLTGNIWTDVDNVGANVTMDLNGTTQNFSGDIHGWNFTDDDGFGDLANNNNVYDDDPESHGTKVAGVIAANGGLNSVYGVAPHVQILPVKIEGESDVNLPATTAAEVAAIHYVIGLKQHGVNIVAINASFGGVHEFDPVQWQAIKDAGDAGILFVAAAGNGVNNQGFYDGGTGAPLASTSGFNNDRQFQGNIGNPGFETDTTGLASWYKVGSATTVSTTGHLTGSTLVARVTGDNVLTNNDYLQELDDLPPGYYTIGAWLKSPNGEPAEIGIAGMEYEYSAQSTDTDWAHVEFTFQTFDLPTDFSGSPYATLVFENAAGGDAVYADDFTMTLNHLYSDNSTNSHLYLFPADYGHANATISGYAALSNVIAVAAIDNNNHLAPFSNYGVNSVQLAAPGVDILSTDIDPNTGLSSTGYDSGTSFAAPMVAGILALEKSANPSATMAQLRDALYNGTGSTLTGIKYGIVNADKALAAISQIRNPGFENGNFTNTWTISSGGTAVVIDSGLAHVDTYAAKIGGTSSSASGVYQLLASNTTGGLTFSTPYVVSAWIKADAGETATLQIQPTGGSPLTATSTSSTYTQIFLPFATGTASNSFTLTLLSTSGHANSYVYFDDLAVAPDIMNGSAGINKTGTDTLTLTGPYANTGPIHVLGGKLVFSGSVTNGGTITLAENSSVNSANATIEFAANATIGQVTGYNGVMAALGGSAYTAVPGTLIIDGSATVTSDWLSIHSLNLNGTSTSNVASLVLRYDNGSVAHASVLSSLTIASNGTVSYYGKLDLTDNKLIIQAADSTSKASMISTFAAATYAGVGNDTSSYWTHNGIITSNATGSAYLSYAVGIYDNGIAAIVAGTLGSNGLTLNSNSIILAIAHVGDADYNGVVNIIDLSMVANNFSLPETNWATGDLSYDGVANIVDFTMVANNYTQSSFYNAM